MRRQLIHYKTGHNATLAEVFTKLASIWHLHFCVNRECRLTYECNGGVGFCADPSKNGRCRPCRGKTRSGWDGTRDPQECCHGNCEQVTDKAELIRYRLAGPGPWFQCKTCARCHGWPCT